MKTETWKKLLYIGLCGIAAVYAFALIKIVLLKYGFTTAFRSVQYVPFHFIQDFVHPEASLDVVLKNVLGNFALFIPLGVLLPALFPKLTFGRTVLAGFLTSLAFELLQLAIGLGATDVDDLILNTLGCLTGAALYAGLFYRAKKPLRARVLSFLFLGVFGCCGILALWLYEPSMLPAQVAFENEAALSGIDRDSYDIDAVCTGIENGSILLRPGETGPNEYPLAEDAAVILERRSYQYSPNGNIQKMTVRYEPVSPADAASALACTEEGCGFADIWLNADGACSRLILTIFLN